MLGIVVVTVVAVLGIVLVTITAMGALANASESFKRLNGDKEEGNK